jgi:hypothetical protein
LLHQDYSAKSHPIDHIHAEKHGGKTVEDNLCLCCVACNLHKGTDLASLDPETGLVVELFHPRRDKWSDHFQFQGAHIAPLTPKGRVIVQLLQINSAERIAEREQLVAAGLFP